MYVGLAFLASLVLVLAVGYGLYAVGQVISPLLIAIILVATTLGVIVSLLEDVGKSSTDFGQLTIAGAMFAEFGSIILLSLFFSREATSTATKLVLLGGFALLAAGFAFVVLSLERSTRIAHELCNEFPRDAQRVCSRKSNWRERVLHGSHVCHGQQSRSSLHGP
jgi:Kef-type K+ transport system membrane component KefB